MKEPELYRTTAVTEAPALTSASTRWLPMKPPAPVTTIFLPVHMVELSRLVVSAFGRIFPTLLVEFKNQAKPSLRQDGERRKS